MDKNETVTASARALREIIAEKERTLEGLKSQLDAFEKACRHDWGEPVYNPVRFPGYTDPGDEPGTMGVDWRGPVYIPERVVPMWTRTCKRCGKPETTSRSETVQQTSLVPKF